MLDRGEGTELNAKEKIREKFSNVPVLEVDSGEIRALDKSAGVMKSLIGWAERKGILGGYKNDDTGWDKIEITRTSVRDVVRHHAGDKKIAVLAIAPGLIKVGIFLKTTERNEKGHKSHIFAGKVKIDREECIVGFTINEDENGRRYYNHELMEINKAPGGSGQAENDSALTSTPAVREPILSIVRRYLFIE